jgi:hypothetical protein
MAMMDATKFLLDRGADPHTQTKKGKTPFRVAQYGRERGSGDYYQSERVRK